VKSDTTIPVRFAVVLAILLGYRVIAAAMKQSKQPGKQVPISS
jgi:hypothetical protein